MEERAGQSRSKNNWQSGWRRREEQRTYQGGHKTTEQIDDQQLQTTDNIAASEKHASTKH
jgi:hypothetical protein